MIFLFYVDHFLKSLFNFLQDCFRYVLIFGHEACRILVSQPGIKPTTPAVEG